MKGARTFVRHEVVLVRCMSRNSEKGRYEVTKREDSLTVKVVFQPLVTGLAAAVRREVSFDTRAAPHPALSHRMEFGWGEGTLLASLSQSFVFTKPGRRGARHGRVENVFGKWLYL